MSRKDKYNSSGCLDMTAYLAIRNIERESRKKLSIKSTISSVGNSPVDKHGIIVSKYGNTFSERRCVHDS